MPTRIRIKLDFVIVLPGDPVNTHIPMVNCNDLIVDGLARVVPSATHVLPGATISLDNLDFMAGLRAKRAADKAKAKIAGANTTTKKGRKS